jgi:hypothetical protein
MNTPLSFEIAKLIKEKGFDNKCIYYFVYTHYGNHIPIDKRDLDTPIYSTPLQINNWNSSSLSGEGTVYIAAPTIAEVVCWIYDNYQIWITAHPEYCNGSLKWIFNFQFLNDNERTWGEQERAYKIFFEDTYKSKEEAYEVCIKYVLNNLI